MSDDTDSWDESQPLVRGAAGDGKGLDLDLDQFRAVVRDTFPALDVTAPFESDFHGEITTYSFDEIQLIRIRASRHNVERSKLGTKSPGTAFYKVMLQRSGTSALSQHDRSIAVEVGDIVAYDTAEPYSLAISDNADLVVYLIPHAILNVPRYMVVDYVVAKVLNSDAAAQPIDGFLKDLADRAHLLPLGFLSRFEPVIAQLVETLFRFHIDEHALRTPKIVKFEEIVGYVEEHLRDWDMTPGSIAKAHFISTRYLQEIFQMHGATATWWIRHRRLEHCRQSLRDPRNANRSVAAIAAEWGFTDAAHFSRVFRREFGVSPSAIRS